MVKVLRRTPPSPANTKGTGKGTTGRAPKDDFPALKETKYESINAIRVKQRKLKVAKNFQTTTVTKAKRARGRLGRRLNGRL
jgi:hypothetical protein